MFVACAGSLAAQQAASSVSVPPRTWDTAALSDWATPLAYGNLQQRFFSEEEYYRAPVDNYRSYPVYDLDREPPGYWESLRRKKPEPLIDIEKIGSSFNWAAAGKRIWEELDTPYLRLYDSESIALARSPKHLRENRNRLIHLPGGTLAMYRWVIAPKGIALGVTACSSCHTKYLPDGTAVAGSGLAQRISDGLLDRMFEQLNRISYAADTPQMALYRQFAVPWLANDIHRRLKAMPEAEIAELFAAQPPGAVDRPNGSPFYITKVPDLIGMRDRKYIDHTATHKHRNAGDLMRYAALVEYSDAMEFGDHRLLTSAQRKVRVRWPDELLYALAQYIYSLQPPPNPNPRGALTMQGEKVFAAAGCPVCHTPPLYTNNKLTLAEGFDPGPNHPLRADILPISVGTDPNLALKTRKGTGLYKVPSLKGVWYRGLYGHDGAVASLEEWFDSNRLRDDYVPTGFKGYRVTHRAVKGHNFGLQLSPYDKKALIAFLRTL